MQRADELASRGEVSVLLRRHFQRIGHRRIGIDRIGHAACFSGIKPQLFSGGWSQIQGHQGIELMRMLDGHDRSEPKHSVRQIDAGAVVRLDTVQIEPHHACRCQFATQDRSLNILDRRFFNLKFFSLRRGQRWRE